MKRKTLILAISLFPLLVSCNNNSSIESTIDSASEIVYYTVTFDGENPQQVLSGEKLQEPEEPVREKTAQYTYTFDGWFLDDYKWEFDKDLVTKNMDLKSGWKTLLNVYTAKFYNDSELLQESRYPYGVKPEYVGEEPTKNGDSGFYYEFTGWDKPITTITSDIEYYAQFTQIERKMEFINLEDTYYPYNQKIKEYLEADNPDVHNYSLNTKGNEPIEIEFKSGYSDKASKYRFYYSLNNDFSNSTILELPATSKKISLNNLYKGSTYYIKLAAIVDGQEFGATTSSFKTTTLGPRTMYIDGIDNVRDIGGYQLPDGKTSLQNKIYRGSEMNGSHGLILSEYGNKVLSEEIGIKLDLDLRLPSDAPGVTESPISSARLEYFSISGYEAAFLNSQKPIYKKIFSALADEKNYPVYIHCWGGADRTGTVCFLINALLGVDYKDLIHDYEYTTFSSFGERNSRPDTLYNFSGFYNQLINDYEGETLQEKVTNYLLDIGISDDEIYNIKAILRGEKTKISSSCVSEFNPALYDSLDVFTNYNSDIKKVLINDEEVSFVKTDNGFTIPSNELIKLQSGSTANGEIVFADNNISEFNFAVTSFDFVSFDEIHQLSGPINVTSQTTFNEVVGYNKFLKLKLKTECGTNGGVYVLIGSYGIYLRGGEFRSARMTTAFDIKEISRNTGQDCHNNTFNNGDKTMFLRLNVSSTSAGFEIYSTDGKNVSYWKFDDPNLKLASNEIESENAKLTISLISGENDAGSQVEIFPTSFVVYCNQKFDPEINEGIEVYCSDPSIITRIEINNAEVSYTISGNMVMISKSQISEQITKDVSGKIFTSSGEYPFNFIYQINVKYFNNEIISLNSSNKQYTSPLELGYDGTEITLKVKSVTGTNGNLYFFIGNYGILLRGSFFRYRTLDSSYSLTSYDERVNNEHTCDTKIFDNTNLLVMSCSIINETTMRFSYKVLKFNSLEVVKEYSFDFARVQNELSSKITLKIDGDAAGTISALFEQVY